MTFKLRSILSLFLLIGAVGGARAQGEPVDWSAWGAVRQFEGTATIRDWSLREWATDVSQERHESEQSITVRFTLEREPRSMESWRAVELRAEMAGWSIYSQSRINGDFLRWSENIEYAGALRDIHEMVLALPPENGRWEVGTPSFTAQPYQRVAKGTRRHDFPKVVEPVAESYPDDDVPAVHFFGQAPKRVGPLEASGVLESERQIDHGRFPALTEFRIVLRPVLDDYQLEVTIEDYAKWRPLGSIAEPGRPGNHLVARATAVRKGGGTPPEVKAIRFALLDTSREPGVCLNWPLGAKDRDPDLRLAAAPECPGALTDEDQRLEVTAPLVDDQRRPYALARVDSYDFGGRSTLYVTAELADGRELVGELKGEDGEASQDLIVLPKMRGPGWIAEVWRKEKKVESLADNSDEEKVEGQQYDGDGFTLYEEYRGWVVAGQRVEGDPERKDFFVLNLIGADARPGIELFEQLSQLRVHDRLRRTEMSEKDRLMNGNRRDAPQRVKQHGVWVKAFDTLAALGGPGAFTPMTKAGVSGRPGITKGVGILARDNADSAFNKPFNLPARDAIFAYDRAIAHELLHSVGVEHHGSGDYTLIVGYISPRHPKNKVGRPYYASSSDTPLGVFNEAGHDLATRDYVDYVKFRQWTDSISGPGLLEEGRQYIARNGVGWLGINTPEQYANDMIELLLVGAFMHLGGVLGVEQGEHSGNQDCVMRYYFAVWYAAKGKDKTYYWITPGTDRIGLEICRTRTGTGVNAPSHKPQARFGDAGANGGNCFSQICPNDAIPPKQLP